MAGFFLLIYSSKHKLDIRGKKKKMANAYKTWQFLFDFDPWWQNKYTQLTFLPSLETFLLKVITSAERRLSNAKNTKKGSENFQGNDKEVCVLHTPKQNWLKTSMMAFFVCSYHNVFSLPEIIVGYVNFRIFPLHYLRME